MEKKIGAYEARRQLGRVLREVAGKGDNYIVERNGEPVAAVVPIELYERMHEQQRKAREELFAIMRAAAETANMSPEEADELALAVVREVRAKFHMPAAWHHRA